MRKRERAKDKIRRVRGIEQEEIEGNENRMRAQVKLEEFEEAVLVKMSLVFSDWLHYGV